MPGSQLPPSQTCVSIAHVNCSNFTILLVRQDGLRVRLCMRDARAPAGINCNVFRVCTGDDAELDSAVHIGNEVALAGVRF